MNKSRPVKGVGWDIGTLGNATWEGAKLSDVLKLAGKHRFGFIKFWTVFSFRQLRRASQSSLASERADFRWLRHEIGRRVSCRKPVFANFSLISPRSQFCSLN